MNRKHRYACLALLMLLGMGLQAQLSTNKLQRFQRAYFGFGLKGAVLAPLVYSNRSQLSANECLYQVPNFQWIASINGLYNISDAWALSLGFGMGNRRINIFAKVNNFEAIGGDNPLYYEMNTALMRRFGHRENSSFYGKIGFELSIMPDETGWFFSMGAYNSGAPLVLPSLPSNDLYHLNLRYSSPSIIAPNIAFGWERAIKNSKHLLNLELSLAYSGQSYARGIYTLQNGQLGGTVRARASNLSLKIAYLFS